MRNPRLASRYAKSLLDLAIEQNVLDAVLADMQLMQKASADSRELVLMLRSPILTPDKKVHILTAIFGGKIHTLTQRFIELLVRKGREFFLPEMTAAFIDQYKVYKKIHVVKLTTAFELDDELKSFIESKVKLSIPEGSIELETEVDTDLIGGFVLQVGDKLFDASVLRDLNDIKKQFTKNEYIPLI